MTASGDEEVTLFNLLQVVLQVRTTETSHKTQAVVVLTTESGVLKAV